MELSIRPLQQSDKQQWWSLWQGYLAFYETRLADDVSEVTWQRLLGPSFDIHGLAGVDDQGTLVGFVHYLYHPVTWSTKMRCYLEDLFTAEESRGQGAGRALIEAVYSAADARGADQVYWLTQDFNKTARTLYDKVATKTPFIKYAR